MTLLSWLGICSAVRHGRGKILIPTEFVGNKDKAYPWESKFFLLLLNAHVGRGNYHASRLLSGKRRTSGELLSRWGSGLLKAARNAAGPFLCWISNCCSSGSSSNFFLTCGGSCKSFSLSISFIIVVAVCVLLRSILAAGNIESLNINGQEIRVRRPIEPQPAGTVQLPAQFTRDVFFVRYENLASLTKCATLVQLCKDYQLSSAGNRDVLRERMEGFSENPIRFTVPADGISVLAQPSEFYSILLAPVNMSSSADLHPQDEVD
ncbi:hypothetical protein D9757_009778 [Collybiopsis confluens]|uniref:SAP domain-containing protein n=1 Tax=Collybiopsis confluens TaxID=2823264 RepID=A0A8H5HFN6_9AGAR|nr:hypothetical protein D9757_009778 [Collybiopsis confluens]